ncbi:hypothetical protein Agub_g3188, partial [Astrephomene gubernaculifera]
ATSKHISMLYSGITLRRLSSTLFARQGPAFVAGVRAVPKKTKLHTTGAKGCSHIFDSVCTARYVITSAMSSPSSSGPQPTPAAAMDFLLLLQQLKLTKRTGWVRKNVNGPESIADHMYRMSMMALLATDSGVDVTRCIKMALVHDVAESIVGDITPHCGVSEADKHEAELRAVGRIRELLGAHTAAAREVECLWLEYEAGASAEALLVKDLDKLEMIITAHQYEQAQPGLLLEEFFASTAGRFKTDTGKAWAAELVARRTASRQQQQQQQQGAEGAAASGQQGGEEGR